MPNRAQAHIYMNELECNMAMELHTVRIPSSRIRTVSKRKESEEEPSEGKRKNEKEKENKAVDSRRCKFDICKFISRVLDS